MKRLYSSRNGFYTQGVKKLSRNEIGRIITLLSRLNKNSKLCDEGPFAFFGGIANPNPFLGKVVIPLLVRGLNALRVLQKSGCE